LITSYEFETTKTENSANLDDYNHTELYQLARKANLNPLPTMMHHELLRLLEGELDQHEEYALDVVRDQIMRFLLSDWRRLGSQLNCPAKSKDPRACHGCIDAQVTHCLTTNPNAEETIRRF
jgi:hypothetical protein